MGKFCLFWMVLILLKIYFVEIFFCIKNEVINVVKGFFILNGNWRFIFFERNDRIGFFDDVVLKKL